jgi:ABC-type uncharacterized transport system ATPase subunit
MAFVPDFPFLYEKLTPREFFRFTGQLFQMAEQRMQSNLRDLIARFNLEAFADKPIEGLSHGTRQRVAIVSALLHDPEALIIDEPMVGLDPQHARVVKDLLKERAVAGMAVLLSTHQLSVAEEMADRAAAAFGVEPRYPFFDRRLMELCLALPADQKLRDGWSRVVMRRAMDGLLPDEVRWRASKANLSPNFRRNLLAKDRNLLAEFILEQPSVLEDYVDISELRRAYRRCTTQPTSETDALTVFGAVVGVQHGDQLPPIRRFSCGVRCLGFRHCGQP